MSSTRAGRLKSWMMKLRYRDKPSASEQSKKQLKVPAKLSNPVENYYRHKAKVSLPFFYRFALQTRSLAIRDVFSNIASKQSLNLLDLLAVIENASSEGNKDNQSKSLAVTFDEEILLTLADLLANTARDELDTHSAVKIYDFVRQVYGDEPFSDQNKLQYVEALHDLERYTEATSLATAFTINEIAPSQQDLLDLHRIWRTADAPQEWLQALNQLYRKLGMSQIRLLEQESVPLMDRLTLASTEPIKGPKITVIMPTFSPGAGIRTAIRSLLEQSWQNLEIIVVNDASPAEYRPMYDEIEELDSRIQVVHQNENAGAYVARNAGLRLATGDFITTHDDDDWSHPDKLAMQVGVMLEDDAIVATTSAHIRTTEDVEFRRVNMQAQFLQMNYSSLMFRRSVAEEIGPWDTVNRGGDSEFYTRLIEYYGEERVVGLREKPMSFSRVWDGSLTSGEMSRGYFAYSRLLYRWAFRQWHWSSAKAGQKAIRKPEDTRPYAVPSTFEARYRNNSLGHFDVIYVTDFFRQAKHVDRALQEIETLSSFGLKVGYMHLYSPETIIPAGIPPKLFELQLTGKVTQIAHDDEATTKLLLLHDPAIGAFLDQYSSRVKSQRSVVVDHKLPTLSGGVARTPAVLSQSIRNLDRFFETSFEVTGGTEQDHERLRRSVPRKRLMSEDLVWSTHVSDPAGEILPPIGRPVVGFHSYGNQYRWPNNADEFRQIYVSDSYTTRLFGQLSTAYQKFGEENFHHVEVVKPEDQGEKEFLSSIDFWVYFPHYRMEDQIWEPVLNAMQAGKVVILPRRLESIYGEAAVYAESVGVAEVVSQLSNNLASYTSQAERGQRLVDSRYTQFRLLNRIQQLIGVSHER